MIVGLSLYSNAIVLFSAYEYESLEGSETAADLSKIFRGNPTRFQEHNSRRSDFAHGEKWLGVGTTGMTRTLKVYS
jgi:hypothetical protein